MPPRHIERLELGPHRAQIDHDTRMRGRQLGNLTLRLLLCHPVHIRDLLDRLGRRARDPGLLDLPACRQHRDGEPHHLPRQIEQAHQVVFLRDEDLPGKHGAHFLDRDQPLRLHVVLEREGLDEFLHPAAELPLVPPALGAVGVDVRDQGAEEVEDLVDAGFVLFGDGGWDGGCDGADAVVVVSYLF